MKRPDNNVLMFIFGFIFGGLIGMAAALLLAPQSGEETREAIRARGLELRDLAAERVEDARLRAERALEDAQLRLDELAQSLREQRQSSGE